MYSNKDKGLYRNVKENYSQEPTADIGSRSPQAEAGSDQRTGGYLLENVKVL